MFPSIEQLQAIYKMLNGEEAGDVHRLRAAHHFNVAYSEVTPEQRAFGKTLNLGSLYHQPIQMQNITRSGTTSISMRR